LVPLTSEIASEKMVTNEMIAITRSLDDFTWIRIRNAGWNES